MHEGRKVLASAAFAANLLACSAAGPEAPPSPAASPFNMPDVQNVQVACVEVPGFLDFSDEACREAAGYVEAGFRLFSEQTGNAIPPPQHVIPKHYTQPLNIKDALGRRCIRIDGASKEEVSRANGLMADIAEAALKQAVDIDFSNSAFYVVANAPASLCRQQGPRTATPQTPNKRTERCSSEDRHQTPLYNNSRALTDLGKPVITSFTPDMQLLTDNARHERGHFGRGQNRLGHEYVLCSKSRDVVPDVIRNTEPDLGGDISGPHGSLMSYADNATYLAPPHEVYLGVVPEGRVINASSGVFTLREATQQGSVVRIPLTNLAIKGVIAATPNSTTTITPDDYRLWLGKMPGQPGVGVYAAPDLGKQQPGLPYIFLLDIVTEGHSFTLEGDVKITENREFPNAATVSVEKLNGSK